MASATPKLLVQGTLYPDVIESGTADASKIKSHHNVGGLPEDMRTSSWSSRCGRCSRTRSGPSHELGLPTRSCGVSRSRVRPGVRIGEVTVEKAAPSQHADAIVREEVRGGRPQRDIWQAFAVLPDPLVGVKGDERTYGYLIIVRAVTSEDAMTADWARLPDDLLERSPAHHRRGRRREPGCLRHHLEAAGHHRVGVDPPGRRLS